MDEDRVVLHIDEVERWDLVLTNVANLIKAYEEGGVQVEVLANAAAVKGYLSNCAQTGALSDRMNELSGRGVRFVACNNALKANNIKTGELLKYVEVVPAGVRELVERQKEGYAYIRP